MPSMGIPGSASAERAGPCSLSFAKIVTAMGRVTGDARTIDVRSAIPEFDAGSHALLPLLLWPTGLPQRVPSTAHSGCAAFVAMVQSADFREGDHVTFGDGLHGSWRGRVFPKG